MPVLNAPPACRASGLGGDINAAVINAALTYAVAAPARVEIGACSEPAVRKLIAAHAVLGTLPEQERCALLRWSRPRCMRRQEVIFHQGDPASSLILVLEGYVKLSAALPDGGEVFLEIAGPGGCVGEMLALQTQTHDADVTALSAGRLLMIDAKLFRQAFDRRPDGLLAMLRLANERLQNTTQQLTDSRARTAPVRLAKALLKVARLPSSSAKRGGRLPLRLSQGELGVMAGMSREIVNKHLGAWRNAGWIEMSGGTVASVDLVALAEMSGDDLDRDGNASAASA